MQSRSGTELAPFFKMELIRMIGLVLFERKYVSLLIVLDLTTFSSLLAYLFVILLMPKWEILWNAIP